MTRTNATVHVWIVTGSTSVPLTMADGSTRMSDRSFREHIVATSIEDAIFAVRKKFGSCDVHTAAHHGEIDIVTGEAREALR